MPKRRRLARNSADFERFVRLGHYMLRSPAWKTLSANAKAVYLEIAARYNGRNNGEIGYAVREAEAIGLPRSVASRALAELQERGFLRVTRASAFNVKTREARLWALTAEPIGDEKATKDFMRWQPPIEAAPNKTQSRQRDLQSRQRDCKRLGATKLPLTVPPEGLSTPPNAFEQSRQRDTSNLPCRERSDAAQTALVASKPIARQPADGGGEIGSRAFGDSTNPNSAAGSLSDEALRAALKSRAASERGFLAKAAGAVGISRQTLSNYVHGRYSINAGAAAKLRAMVAQ